MADVDYDSILNALTPTPPTGYASKAQIAQMRAYANQLQQQAGQRNPYTPYTWGNAADTLAKSLMAGLSNRNANQLEQNMQEAAAQGLPDITGTQGNVPGAPGASPGNPAAQPQQGPGGMGAPGSPNGPPPGSPVKFSGDPADTLGFIKAHEGFSAAPYADGAQTSIGYGTKARPDDKTITPEEAHSRVVDEAGKVQAYLDKAAKVPLTPAQRTALTSFGYNAGQGALEKVMPDVNAGNFKAAADRMGRYIRFNGTPSQDLIGRRSEEMNLLTKPQASPSDDARFPPPSDIHTLPPGSMPNPPPIAQNMPSGPAGSMMQPASFNPSAGGAAPSPAAPMGAPAAGPTPTAGPPGAMPGGPQPAAAAQPQPPMGGAHFIPPTSQLPPGTPSDDQIRALIRNPQTEEQGKALWEQKQKLLAPQMVSQPDGTMMFGNPFTGFHALPFMGKPDIVKSPLKVGGNEFEQNLVPTRGPDGQPMMKEMNPILGGPKGALAAQPQGGVQPTGIQPAANVQPGGAPSPAAGGLPAFPPNPNIDNLTQWGQDINTIAKERGTAATVGETARQGPIGEAIKASSTVPAQLQQLGVIREALKVPGISGGAWGPELQHFKSALQQIIPGYHPEEMGAGERLNKANIGLAGAATRELSSRAPLQEFVFQLKAVPGLMNSVETSKYLENVMTQQAYLKQGLGKIATENTRSREFAQDRDDYYAAHPILSPLTGKPIDTIEDAHRDNFALAIKAGASSGDLMKLGKSFDMSPEQVARTAAEASKDMAAKESGGAPSVPSQQSGPTRLQATDPAAAQEEAKRLGLKKGDPVMLHDGRIGTVP